MVEVEIGLKGRFAAALLVLATIAASNATVAHGAELAAQLNYELPPGCPAAADFKSLVTRRLGYDPFRDEAREQVVVRVERSGAALEGRLEWRNAAGGSIGEHTFPSRTGDCEELVGAMAFSLALQMQLMAVAKSEAPPATPTPPPVVPPANVAPAAPEPPNVPPAIAAPGSQTSRAVLAVGAGAAVGVGLSQNPVAIGRVFGSVAWSRVGFELAAEVSSPSTTRQANGTGFSQHEAFVSLAGCGLGGPFSACLLAKGGEIRVTGQGLTSPSTSSALVLQGGFRLAVTQMLGSRSYVVAHGDGVTSLTRGIVTIDSMPVWTTPRVAGLFGVDVGIRFR